MLYNDFINIINKFQENGDNKTLKVLIRELNNLDKKNIIKHCVDYFCTFIPTNDINEIFMFYDSISNLKQSKKVDIEIIYNLLYILTRHKPKHDKFKHVIVDNFDKYKQKLLTYNYNNITDPKVIHLLKELDENYDITDAVALLYDLIIENKKYYSICLAYLISKSRKKIKVINPFSNSSSVTYLSTLDNVVWKMLYIITNSSPLIDRLFYIYSMTKIPLKSNLLLYCVSSVSDNVENFINFQVNTNHMLVNIAKWIEENKLVEKKDNLHYLKVITRKR